MKTLGLIFDLIESPFLDFGLVCYRVSIILLNTKLSLECNEALVESFQDEFYHYMSDILMVIHISVYKGI